MKPTRRMFIGTPLHRIVMALHRMFIIGSSIHRFIVAFGIWSACTPSSALVPPCRPFPPWPRWSPELLTIGVIALAVT